MLKSCEIQLKPYKGFNIIKTYDISNGRKLNVAYLVCDEWIIDCFTTLKGAKKYIDKVLL